jgi:hypothetical protein
MDKKDDFCTGCEYLQCFHFSPCGDGPDYEYDCSGALDPEDPGCPLRDEFYELLAEEEAEE